MSKTPPGFFFYPGDYLRDTQCLSEKCQVAYDRLMCEHMRKISKDKTNIHVSQETLDFFTKRLSVEEKEELMHVLQKVEGGYQIEWVSLSISKSKNYSESRAKNRSVKNKEDTITHVNTSEHMEEEEGYVYNIIVDSNKEGFNNLKEENFEKKFDYVFCMQKIYEKNWEEYRMCLNGQAKFLNEEIFDRWKNFVDLVSEKFTSLLSTKFISPIDFGKIIKDEKFTEEKWEEVLKEILATGAKPEHELFFRIPKFMEIVKNKKNGNNNRKNGTSEGQISAARKFATGEY